MLRLPPLGGIPAAPFEPRGPSPGRGRSPCEGSVCFPIDTHGPPTCGPHGHDDDGVPISPLPDYTLGFRIPEFRVQTALPLPRGPATGWGPG